jgi:sugar lactone lactonase YvrE
MNAHRYYKRLAALVAVMLVLLVPGQAFASEPYVGYTYNSLGDDVHSINGYMYMDSIDGYDMPTGPFNAPEDMFVAADDTLYVVDTGNNRIVHMTADHRLLQTYGDEDGPGKLNGPKGVFVKNDGTVYAADTKNQRIAIFRPDGTFDKELKAPASQLLGKDFSYSPSKLIVDKRDYLFVVSDGNTQGLIQLDPNGSFKGFFGANHVGFSLMRLLIKLVATKEQKAQLSTVKPFAFSNIAQDNEGFIYTTTFGTENNQIERLSPVGVDTLNAGANNMYGDYYVSNDAPLTVPSFASITVDDGGMITALDLQTSKVFQYDKLGNLLFVFGGTGDQDGLFVTPSAVGQSSDGHLYVVDKGRNRIDRFRVTPFADLVHKASKLYVDGRYEESESMWKQVLQLNANYDMAYKAIGKSLYRSEKYQEAMQYFKLGHDRDDYSAAFGEYRKIYARNHFTAIVGLLLLLYLIVILALPWSYRRLKRLVVPKTGNPATLAQKGDSR